jgi:hypothetical protein
MVHLDRIDMRLVQPFQRFHHPSLAILERNRREMPFQKPQIIWVYPSDQVCAFRVSEPGV